MICSMSDQQNSDVRASLLARCVARLREARRRRLAGKLSLDEAANRAAADLEGR